MNTFRIGAVARDDLTHIHDYIAGFNPKAAAKLMASFEKKFALLAQFPELGARSELAPRLRETTVRKYRIFYRRVVADVEIVRVLHGARNITEDFLA